MTTKSTKKHGHPLRITSTRRKSLKPNRHRCRFVGKKQQLEGDQITKRERERQRERERERERERQRDREGERERERDRDRESTCGYSGSTSVNCFGKHKRTPHSRWPGGEKRGKRKR